VWQDGVGICFNVTEQFSRLHDVLAKRVDLSNSELLDVHTDAGAALDCRGGAVAELREARTRHVFGDDDNAASKCTQPPSGDADDTILDPTLEAHLGEILEEIYTHDAANASELGYLRAEVKRNKNLP
jgi:hypothetical protein